MLLAEENRSPYYRLEGCRLHLCLLECVCLFITVQEGPGQSLDPSSHPAAAGQREGRS